MFTPRSAAIAKHEGLSGSVVTENVMLKATSRHIPVTMAKKTSNHADKFIVRYLISLR